MDPRDSLRKHLEARERAGEGGQQTRLASYLEVTPAQVWQWLDKRRPIAPRHARKIEAYTRLAPQHGVITANEVAPEVFGPPSQTGENGMHMAPN
jgi:DNA-binding transcriptional regulator YdaS (Cro superfamily)